MYKKKPMYLFPRVTRNNITPRSVPTRRSIQKTTENRSGDRSPRIGLVFVGIYSTNGREFAQPDREPIPIDGMYKISSRASIRAIFILRHVFVPSVGLAGGPPVVDIYLPRMERKKKKERIRARQRGNTKLILMAVSLSAGGTARGPSIEILMAQYDT